MQVFQTMHPESGFRIVQIGHKSKKDNDVTIYQHDVIFKCFWRCFFSFVKFIYCSKFHANIITGPAIMTIFL